jgi:hypothetical protein
MRSGRNDFEIGDVRVFIRPVTRFPDSGLFIEEPTIAPDGRHLAYNRGRGGSSLWMLTFTTASSDARP